jgi:hypothetical protein
VNVGAEGTTRTGCTNTSHHGALSFAMLDN